MLNSWPSALLVCISGSGHMVMVACLQVRRQSIDCSTDLLFMKFSRMTTWNAPELSSLCCSTVRGPLPTNATSIVLQALKAWHHLGNAGLHNLTRLNLRTVVLQLFSLEAPAPVGMLGNRCRFFLAREGVGDFINGHRLMLYNLYAPVANRPGI